MQDDPMLSKQDDEIPDVEINYVVLVIRSDITAFGPFFGSEAAWDYVKDSDIELDAIVVPMMKPKEPIPF